MDVPFTNGRMQWQALVKCRNAGPDYLRGSLWASRLAANRPAIRRVRLCQGYEFAPGHAVQAAATQAPEMEV